jgi:hypothetical protein
MNQARPTSRKWAEPAANEDRPGQHIFSRAPVQTDAGRRFNR